MAAPRTPREVADWAAETQAELSKLLARHETSTHRVMTVTESYKKLTQLNLKQINCFAKPYNARSMDFTGRRTLRRSPHLWIIFTSGS